MKTMKLARDPNSTILDETTLDEIRSRREELRQLLRECEKEELDLLRASLRPIQEEFERLDWLHNRVFTVVRPNYLASEDIPLFLSNSQLQSCLITAKIDGCHLTFSQNPQKILIYPGTAKSCIDIMKKYNLKIGMTLGEYATWREALSRAFILPDSSS